MRHCRHRVVPILYSTFLLCAPARAVIPETEKQVLVDLYATTGGDAWTDKTRWLGSPGTECTWKGIKCDDRETTVVEVKLHWNNLAGGIPANLSKLTNLQELWLMGNNLSGAIPRELGGLTALKELRLRANALSGTIPAELGALGRLEELDFGINQLSGPIPPELGHLRSLGSLDLGQNRLSGPIPKELGSLSSLEHLWMGQNTLSGQIPGELGNLAQLTDLTLGSNQLTGQIPVQLCNLNKLESLYLGGNSLSDSIPACLGNLRDLTVLHLWGNQLSGPIPAELGSLTKLQSLMLDSNALTGSIPGSLGAVTSLTDLELQTNQLTGPIPDALARLTNLEYLLLGNNELDPGPVPAWIGSLTKLQHLYLSGCHRTGSFPAWVDRLPALVYLGLSRNALSGTVPADLSFPRLQYFYVQSNALTGPAGSRPALRMAAPDMLGFDVRWNAFAPKDPAIKAYLDANQPGWDATQTAPPTGVTATPASSTSVTVSWTPIPYTGDSGGYRVLLSTTSGGPYTEAGTTLSKAASSLAVTGLAPSTTYYVVVRTATEPHANNANALMSEASAEVGVTTGSCPIPGGPALLGLPASITSGQTLVASWSAAAGLLDGGIYVLETSRDGFSSVATSVTARTTSAVISTTPSTTAFTLALRVRAVQPCGTGGPASTVATVAVGAAAASFVLTRAGPSWTAASGDAPPTATVTFRNVGPVVGRLTITWTGNFFGVSPSTLDVAPFTDGSVTLVVSTPLPAAPGVYQGLVTATPAGGASIATPVSLTVVPSKTDPFSRVGTRVRASVGTVTFSAPRGSEPAARSIEVRLVSVTGSGPVFLTPTVGPGGSWLVLGDLSAPVPASGSLLISLAVDRSRRSPKEGGPPLRTLLKLTPVGADPEADSALVEVLDVDEAQPRPGAGERDAAPPSGSSFVVPSAVKAYGAGGASFVSDGWLRNLDGSSRSAVLYYTPDGANGLAGFGVLAANVDVPAGTTVRLSDLVSTYFAASGSGEVELRAASPAAFSLRTTVEASTEGDPTARFGTEIPTVAYGSGAALDGPEWIVPGVDDDSDRRTNLILAETRGGQATARVVVVGASGTILGSTYATVPAYGKVQINSIATSLLGGASVTGGSFEVSVVSGQGRLVPIATVIDNHSGSFSAILGQGPRRAAAGRAALEQAAPPLLIPSVVGLMGAGNTRYTTNISLRNGTATAANLTLTYTYADMDDGGRVKSVVKTAMLPPRAALSRGLAENVILNLFGVSAASYGSILVEGDVTRVIAVASIATLVDAADPTKGKKTSQVNGLLLDAPEVMAASEGEVRFAGAEKSAQRRTNLILEEVDGNACDVVVRLNGPGGETLAQRSFHLDGRQYLQVNDIFGDAGMALGPGPYQNMEITAQVVAGTGRAVALATVIDNVSRSPEIFVLQPPGPPAGGTIGL